MFECHLFVTEQGSGTLSMPMPLPVVGRASVVTEQGRLLPHRIAHNALARTKRAHSRQQKGMVINAGSSSEVHRFAISPPEGELECPDLPHLHLVAAYVHCMPYVHWVCRKRDAGCLGMPHAAGETQAQVCNQCLHPLSTCCWCPSAFSHVPAAGRAPSLPTTILEVALVSRLRHVVDHLVRPPSSSR